MRRGHLGLFWLETTIAGSWQWNCMLLRPEDDIEFILANSKTSETERTDPERAENHIPSSGDSPGPFSDATRPPRKLKRVEKKARGRIRLVPFAKLLNAHWAAFAGRASSYCSVTRRHDSSTGIAMCGQGLTIYQEQSTTASS
ncbi:hypothetical protein LY76DRAFT_231038 [Colletotrichum caudatum]|nr:hypothetical protein LY76DRAFT_231038 [Colletotrichum caudatum]